MNKNTRKELDSIHNEITERIFREKIRTAKRTHKKLRLPRSNNGHRRKTASLGCYQYQKDELIRRAEMKGMTVSYYINWLLWRDWLISKEEWNNAKGKME